MAEEELLPDTPKDRHISEFTAYWRVIVGRFRIIAAMTAGVMLCAIVYYSMIPNLYQATVQVLVERMRTTEQQMAQELYLPSFRGEDDYYGTQIAILTGRKISSKVSEALGLPFPYPYKIQATRMRSTRIISLSITHKDPKMAADIANKFADTFVQENLKEGQFITEQILKYIPEISEMKADDASASLKIEGLDGFSKKEFAESFASVMEDSVIQKMKAEKIELEAKLNEYSQRYKPQHPVMIELTDRLKYIDNELKSRTATLVNNLRVGLSGKIRINNVKVLEPAVVPLSPSEPRRLLGVLIFTALGFIASVWIIVFIELVNEKVRTEDDIENYLDIPFLGYVPVVKELSRNMKDGGPQAITENISPIDVLKHSSVLSDAITSLRTHILFSMPYDKSKKIMFTSAIPEEGKSTVAMLLALSLVMLGRKILLIDSDLRRPSIHSYMNLKNEVGLTDFLTGHAEFNDIVRGIAGSGLKVITSGSHTSNPSELLSSDRFHQLLDTASETFDRVIIDVPPVLFIADGLIIAKNVHSGVLVCGSGMVARKTIKDVTKKFAAVGHSFIGIIINHADYEKEGYRYQYYRNYKSYYSRRT